MPASSQQPLQRITINDFRPGIQSNVRIPSVSGAAVLSTAPGFAAEGTTQCIATQTGELAPLPKKQAVTIGGVPIFNTLLDPTAFWRPIGFGCAGPVPDPNFNVNNQFGFDELHLAVSGITNSSGHNNVQFLYETAPLTPIGTYGNNDVTFTGTNNHVPDTTLASVVASSWGMTWEYTRAENATFTNAGRPTSFSEWTEIRVGTNNGGPSGLKKWIICPDPTAPATAFNTGNLTAPIHYFSHNARILALQDNAYTHINYTVQSNELIAYADPPNNWQLGTANTVLDPQEPTGYGAWGSISYGEFVFIKRSSGAILMSGDIYSPQITKLPGVIPTGNLLQKGTRSPAGLVYCVDADGAYVWNGGNTSQKISTIRDDFHVRANGNSAWGVTTQHCSWGPYVVFANGWLYDTLNQSWWNLHQATGLSPASIGMVCQSVSNPKVLYTVNDFYSGVNGITPDFYSMTTPSSTYTWIGQPIPISQASQIDIREATIELASPLTTNVDVEVTVKDLTGADIPVINFTNQALQSNQPQAFRSPCGVRGWNVTPSVNVSAHNGTDPAPNVISITFGIEPAAPVGQGG